MQLGENGKARKLLESFINTNPTSSNAILMLGMILDQERDYPGASDCYHNFILLAPDSPKVQAIKHRIDEISKTVSQPASSSSR